MFVVYSVFLHPPHSTNTPTSPLFLSVRPDGISARHGRRRSKVSQTRHGQVQGLFTKTCFCGSYNVQCSIVPRYTFALLLFNSSDGVIVFPSCELACLRFDVRRCLLNPQSELDIMMVKPGWNEVPSMRRNVHILEARLQNFRNLVVEMAIAKAGNVLRRWFGGKQVSLRPLRPTVC